MRVSYQEDCKNMTTQLICAWGCHAIATLVLQQGCEIPRECASVARDSNDLATRRETCLFERVETIKLKCTLVRHVYRSACVDFIPRKR